MTALNSRGRFKISRILTNIQISEWRFIAIIWEISVVLHTVLLIVELNNHRTEQTIPLPFRITPGRKLITREGTWYSINCGYPISFLNEFTWEDTHNRCSPEEVSIRHDRLILVNPQPISTIRLNQHQTLVNKLPSDQQSPGTHISVSLDDIEQDSFHGWFIDINPVSDQMTRSAIEGPNFWFSAGLLRVNRRRKRRRSRYRSWLFVRISRKFIRINYWTFYQSWGTSSPTYRSTSQ